jgi:uncharacterized membrane protein YjgN (DUF898 family)
MTEPDAFGAPMTPAVPRRFQVEFTGTGGEYFRIWIVNLLLTIITIGIYSAWAKVRKMQYFYRNTRVDGAVFDYHGRPWAILKGRVIVLVLIVAYNIAFRVSFLAGMVIALALAAAMPWLLAQSQRFRLHNSSYRGLRFRFLGSVREAYGLFTVPLLVMLILLGWFMGVTEKMQPGVVPSLSIFILPGLVYLGLVLYWPYLHFRFKRYQHANSALGHTQSTFSGNPLRFYKVYGAAVAMLVGVAVVLFGSIAILATGRGAFAAIAGGLALLLFYVALLAVGPYIAARLQNHVWSATRIGPVSFGSAVRPPQLIWIVISNLVLIVFTLGLFTPFAAVRVARYKLQSVTVIAEDDLANFVGASAAEVAAVGEGAADLFDVDFAL